MAECSVDSSMVGENHAPGRKVKICEPCKKKNKSTEAKVYCKQCGEFQCCKCEKAHEIFDFMSGHERCKVDEAPAMKNKTPKTSAVDLKGLDKCETHGKRYKYYCVDHDILSCSACAVETHRQCKEVNAVMSQVKKTKPEISNLISSLNGAIGTTSIIKETSKAMVDSIKIELEDLPREIDQVNEQVMEMLESLKSKVLKEARDKGDAILEEEDVKQSKCSDICKTAEKLLSTMTSVHLSGSAEQVFVVSKLVKGPIENIRKDIASITRNKILSDVKFAVNFEETLTNILNPGTVLGTLIETKTCVNFPTRLTLKKAIDPNLSEERSEQPAYTGLAFLPDGRLVGVDCRKSKCNVMNESLRTLGSYTFPCRPFDVTAISGTTVVVSNAEKKLYILDVGQDHVISKTEVLKCNSKVGPLCAKNDNSFIVRFHEEDQYACTLSLDGKLRLFSGLKKSICLRWNSRYLYLPAARKFIITDDDRQAVYLYDVTGHECTLQTVVKHDEVKRPAGLCAGPLGTMFVSCKETDSIVQITLAGEVVNVTKVNVKCPIVLSASQDGTKLAVSNEMGTLQVYTLD